MLLAAKLILNKNTSTAGVTCPCGHTCDAKPNLTSSENTAGVIKSPGDTFKRPKPKVEPQDEFQAQLDKFQPKSYSKRFRSKNLIVHRVHPLNTPSPPPRTHPTPSRTTVQSPSNSMSPSQSNNIPPSSVISHPTSSMQDSLYTISGEVRSDIASSTLGGLRSDGSSTHSGIRSDGLPSSGIRSDNASSKLGGLRSDVASTHSGLRSEGSASSGIRSDGASPAQGGLRSDGASPVESGVRSSERSLHSGLRSDTDSGLRSGSEVKSGGNSNNNGDTSDFLGNLMDTSLSSTAAKDAVAVLDELMDISFPHLELEASTSSSPNNFTGLIPTKEDSISLPSSPSKLLKEGENKWLSSEVADYSLSSLLGHLESPAKPAIPSDMQSMMSESSVDYMAKFADLAAQMANDETCKN
ncbi:hypothetical protein M8J75_004784 [Diaphorina citri]|nr:hypothetical protein M8J75_004784 [Diaphorina citri]